MTNKIFLNQRWNIFGAGQTRVIHILSFEIIAIFIMSLRKYLIVDQHFAEKLYVNIIVAVPFTVI